MEWLTTQRHCRLVCRWRAHPFSNWAARTRKMPTMGFNTKSLDKIHNKSKRKECVTRQCATSSLLCTCIRFSPWNRFVKRMRTHKHFNYEQTCEISFRTVGLRTWAPRLGVELKLDRQVRAPDKQKAIKSKHHQPHCHESCGIAHHQRHCR